MPTLLTINIALVSLGLGVILGGAASQGAHHVLGTVQPASAIGSATEAFLTRSHTDDETRQIECCLVGNSSDDLLQISAVDQPIMATDTFKRRVAPRTDELASVGNHSALPPSLDDKVTFAQSLKILNAIDSSQRQDLLAFIELFSTLNPDNVFLPAIYKAVIQKLASTDFAATLDEALFALYLTSRVADDHNDYWNNLAVSTLAEQQPDLVHKSVALVSALFVDPSSHEIEASPITKSGIDDDNEALLTGNTDIEWPNPTNAAELADKLNELANIDPLAALTFIQNEVSNAIDKDELTVDLFYTWVQNDPATALTNISEIINSNAALGEETAVELGELFVSQKVENSPLEAFEWVRTQPNEELRSSVLESVLIPWIENDPNDALSYLAQLNLNVTNNAATDDSQVELAENIVAAFALNGDEQQAAEWLSVQTDPEVVASGIRLLADFNAE